MPINPLDLTPAQIAKAFPGAPLANIETHWPHVRAALRSACLDSRMLVAYALATIAAESAGFKPIAEGVSKYNTNAVPFDLYNNRESLGNGPADGARYKGRGFMQLTGRDNYSRYGARLGISLINDPNKANDPAIAAQLLALFVADRREAILSALNASDFAKARRAVNGGTHGLARFTNAYKAILRAVQ